MRSPLKTSAIVLAAVLAALLLVGTLWDEPISQAIHHPASGFGIFFAAFGEMPAIMAIAVSGSLLILARNRERRGVAVGQLAGGVILVALATPMALFMPGQYLDVHAGLLTGVGLLVLAASVMFARWMAKDADRQVAVRISLIVLLVVVVEMALVNLLKFPFERPRVRLLAEHPEIAFQPWFVIGNDAMNDLLASGVAREEFKSFPSGHTANGAVLMLLAAVAPLQATLARHQRTLLWIGAGWGLLVGASRVVIGAHFVSDTVVGFSITFTLVVIAHRAIQRVLEPAPTVEGALR